MELQLQNTSTREIVTSASSVFLWDPACGHECSAPKAAEAASLPTHVPLSIVWTADPFVPEGHWEAEWLAELLQPSTIETVQVGRR